MNIGALILSIVILIVGILICCIPGFEFVYNYIIASIGIIIALFGGIAIVESLLE